MIDRYAERARAFLNACWWDSCGVLPSKERVQELLAQTLREAFEEGQADVVCGRCIDTEKALREERERALDEVNQIIADMIEGEAPYRNVTLLECLDDAIHALKDAQP